MSWILNKGRKPKKEFLLEELAKEDLQVLSLAYVYAKNLQMYGIDITKAIGSAAENMEIISRAHQQGYYDAMDRIKSESENNTGLCRYDISKKCEGKYKDCLDCVLDNIKAEIEEWTYQADRRALAQDPYMVDTVADLFIQIINKYKAESGDKR